MFDHRGQGPFSVTDLRWSASDRPFTVAEAAAVALAAVVPAVAFSVVAMPVAGIVWLLAALPGVAYVLAGDRFAARRSGRAGKRPRRR